MVIWQGTTKQGEPCRKIARNGTPYCHHHQPAEPNESEDIYERLAKADPEGKAAIVRQLIAEDPEGKLKLPPRSGTSAKLERINLQGAYLQGANLKKAYLQQAYLQGVNLEKADLQRANLQQAILRNANLWGVNFRGADFRQSDLRGANLQYAKLWASNLRQANLYFANLQEADLLNANLQEADLSYANLQKANLGITNLSFTDLTGADLQEANLVDANLEVAILKGAKLQYVDLSTCNLAHIYIAKAWLEKTRLYREQLSGAIGEEFEAKNKQHSLEDRLKAYEDAKYGYLILKQNFDDLGDYDAASWAYCKERRLEKMEALLKGHKSFKERQWRDVANYYWQAFLDQFVELLCDYGESIPRTLMSLLVVYLIFTGLYWSTWGVVRIEETAAVIRYIPTRDLSDVALYSLGAMTTMNPADLVARTQLIDFLAGVEAFLGIAITGLLGFVLGNRIRQS